MVLWDVIQSAAPREIAQIPAHKNWLTSMAFSRDGHMLATADYGDEALLWDVRQSSAPRRLSVLTGHER